MLLNVAIIKMAFLDPMADTSLMPVSFKTSVFDLGGLFYPLKKTKLQANHSKNR